MHLLRKRNLTLSSCMVRKKISQICEIMFCNSLHVTWRQTDRKNKGNKRHIFVAFFPELTQTLTKSIYITVERWYRETEWLMLSVLLYSILRVQIVYSVQLNCTDSNYRKKEWLMLSALLYSILSVQIVYSVQLNCTDSNYRETELLLCWLCYCTTYWMYRYCTVCNWTILKVITERQSYSYIERFHARTFTVQLLYRKYRLQQNSTNSNYTQSCCYIFSCTTAQHIYCTNCTICNWTVLTVIKQKLLLHVQLQKSTAHLLYKLYSLQLNSTYSN